jgi:hypothetical protein
VPKTCRTRRAGRASRPCRTRWALRWSRRSCRRRALVAGAAAPFRSCRGPADAELNDLGIEPALQVDGPGRSACQRFSRRTRRIRQQHTSVAMQSIAAVPAVATTPTTSAIMSQTLGVTSTWSGGRGSGIRPSGRAEAAMLKSLVAGATEMISFPSGIALPTRFGHARGTTAGGCGGAACRSYTAAWRQQVRRPTWRRSCDLLDPHGERSCAGPSGPDSARPSQWAVAGHVTSVGVGGLDPHGCGR